ncbi:hypothetical protein TOC8171_03390 [Pseudomonas syringae]
MRGQWIDTVWVSMYQIGPGGSSGTHGEGGLQNSGPNPRNDKALNNQGFALPNMAEA